MYFLLYDCVDNVAIIKSICATILRLTDLGYFNITRLKKKII